MFSFLRRKRQLDLSGRTDWHCHILPGVDDGVQTLDEALAVLSDYEQAGIARVWLTPHIMEDVPNATADLRCRFAELKEAYKGPVELHLAAENMLDSLFTRRLECGDVLPIGSEGDMLLVETSYFSAPMNFHRTLQAIKAHGFHPLLAHPERYSYITTLDEYKRLRDMGVRFQLNLMSLGGHYGPAARHKAESLLKNDFYHLAGTDLHRRQHIGLITHITLPAAVRIP